MKNSVLHKIILICGIFANILLFIDLNLFSVWQFKNGLDNYNYDIASKKISNLLKKGQNDKYIGLTNNIPPIIILPSHEFATPQDSIWIEVSSSSELITGIFKGYIIRPDEYDTDDTIYKYYLGLDDLGEEGEFEIKFLDKKEQEVTKKIFVEKSEINVLGISDERKETILPDGDYLNTVIDKEYGLSYSYEPDDLVYLSDYEIPYVNSDKQIRSIVVEDLKRMCEDAKEEGYNLVINSAYRSYQDQLNLYNYIIQRYGYGFADESVAYPGHSEHQLGTAIDFTSSAVLNGYVKTFDDASESDWLFQNAYKYGFILSYPNGGEEHTGYKHESWHYRYFGIEKAKEIYESGKIPIEYLKEINNFK